MASHYRAREILQNRVDNRVNSRGDSRARASLEEKEERVFATEIERARPQKKKIFI